MSRLSKTFILGVIVGILGLIISLMPFVRDLEEMIGLGLLFKERRIREVPNNGIILAIDKFSADKLNLPDDPDSPRIQ